LATAESNRAIPAYQAGPVDQLGRGQQMAEVPTPSARAPFRVQAGPATRQVHSPWRKTVDTIHRAFTPTAFQTGTTTWWFHLPRRRAGDSNATVLPAHPLATEPGTLAGSPSMSGGPGQARRAVRTDLHGHAFPAALRAPPEIRTRNLFLLREAPLPSWARRAFESDRPDSNRY
jgi:hypothetical protein